MVKPCIIKFIYKYSYVSKFTPNSYKTLQILQYLLLTLSVYFEKTMRCVDYFKRLIYNKLLRTK